MERIEAAISSQFVRWVRAVDRHARAVLAGIALTTLVAAGYAALNLGINSDNVSLIADHLEARRNYLEFAESFPNIENVILVVIDGETPEIARDAAQTLEEGLGGRTEFFHEVYIPGSGEFFERHGLLYRDLADLAPPPP